MICNWSACTGCPILIDPYKYPPNYTLFEKVFQMRLICFDGTPPDGYKSYRALGISSLLVRLNGTTYKL